MKVVSYISAIVFLSLYQDSSAYRIVVQATPNNIYPVLTKLLTLQCGLQKDIVANQTNGTKNKREFDYGALIHHVNQRAVAGASTHPYTALTTHANTALPTHPSTALPTNPNTTQRSSASVVHSQTSSQAHYQQTSPPSTINYTTQLSATTAAHLPRTTLSQTSTVSHVAETNVDVSHIVSIIVSKRDKVTGNLQPVAKISPYDPPTASIDLENIHVEGNLEFSEVARGKGYIEVTWDYPSEAQAGEYICDIYALDSTLHPVSLSSSVQITASEITVSALAGYVAQTEKYVNQLTQSLTEVTNELSILKLENQLQLEALQTETKWLINQTEYIKAQNIQTGSFSCDTITATTFIHFSVPYVSVPTVFLSLNSFQSQPSYPQLSVTILSLNSTGFRPSCTVSQITNTNLQWIAIDN